MVRLIHEAPVWWFISDVVSEISDEGLAREGDSIEQLISESYDEGFQSCYHDTKGSSALELTSSEGRWSDRVFLGDGDAYSKFHARIRFIA